MSESDRTLAALASLHQIGSAVNRLDAGDFAGVQVALEMIVRGAAKLIPGAAIEIYTYDTAQGICDLDSAVSTDAVENRARQDAASAAGLGARAAAEKRRLLSYEETSVLESGAAAAHPVCSLGCFPLITAGTLDDEAEDGEAAVSETVLGVLYVIMPEAQHFSEAELLVLGNFSNLAAMALSISGRFVMAQQEQARKERDLRRMRRAAMLISSRSNLKETLDSILEVALDITDAIYGVFRLVDRSGRNLVCMAITGAGLESPAVEVLPINGASIMATVASQREPVVVSDLREEPWKDIYYPLDHQREMRSEVAVPLIGASGRLEGVLNLESPLVAAFDKEDRYILQILASQAVVAIQEARLLDALQEISLLLPRLPRQMIYQKLVEQACDLLNVPFGMIWLLEKEQIVCGASSDPAWIGLRLGAEEGLAGKAISESQPLVVNAHGNSDGVKYPDLPAFEGAGAALAMPLFASPDGKPLGAFSVHTAQADPRDFDQSDWDKKVLDILGHYAALAVQLAEQQEALRVAQDQRALTEAFAAIGDIAANLLHRLNNKIGTIPVRIEGIQDKAADLLQTEPYFSRNLEAIQVSASEAMEIVRESLFHLHPVQLAPVSISASARQAVASARLPETFRVQLDDLDALPPVMSDSTRLALVFHNLLENAADAMEGEGSLRISGTAEQDWVLVNVIDDGPGIPEENHERIFEFNYSVRARSQPGRLGFGLWWVKSLMARFGGSVMVESDGSHGTTFVLRLPRAKPQEHTSTELGNGS